MQQYNDPEQYAKRYLLNETERYLHDRWYPFLFSKIKRFCKGKVVIDLGCGAGGCTAHMTNAKLVIAVDLSAPMIEYCVNKFREFSNVRLHLGDICKCPVDPEAIDFAFIDSLHLVDPEALFTECNRIVKSKGAIMVIVRNKWNFLWVTTGLMHKIMKKKAAYRADSYKDIKKKLEHHGFIVKEMKSFGMLTYSPLFLQKYVKYLWILMDKIYAPLQRIFPLGAYVVVIALKTKR